MRDRKGHRTKLLTLTGVDDGWGAPVMHVSFDTLGEPFREVVMIDVNDQIDCTRIRLQVDEVKQLRDKLNEFLGE